MGSVRRTIVLRALGDSGPFVAARQPLEPRAGEVVDRLERRQHDPVVVWKAQDQEGAPDREDRADVLRMRGDRERKRVAPRDVVSEPVAVEDADAAETVEDPDVERLAGRDEAGANRHRPAGGVGRPRAGPSVREAPPGEDADLQRLEPDEERAQRFGRPRREHAAAGADRAEGVGRAPRPHVARALDREQQRRGEQHVDLHAVARRASDGMYDRRSVTGSEISFTNQIIAIRTSCLIARYTARSATTNTVHWNQWSAMVSRLAARHRPALKMSRIGRMP